MLTAPRLNRGWRRLRCYLVPLLLTLSLACGYASSLPPPTLKVQEPTATFTDAANELPTPSLPARAIVDRPVDPAMRALLNSVQSDQLIMSVRTLADMPTHHLI